MCRGIDLHRQTTKLPQLHLPFNAQLHTAGRKCQMGWKIKERQVHFALCAIDLW